MRGVPPLQLIQSRPWRSVAGEVRRHTAAIDFVTVSAALGAQALAVRAADGVPGDFEEDVLADIFREIENLGVLVPAVGAKE